MSYTEQAKLLKEQILKANRILNQCRNELTEDELQFRLDSISGMLTIASQDMTALINSWRTAELLAETLHPNDDKLFTVAPDPDCKICNGCGEVSDRVDYGSTTTLGPSSLCSCVEEQIPVELDDTHRINLMIPDYS